MSKEIVDEDVLSGQKAKIIARKICILAKSMDLDKPNNVMAFLNVVEEMIQDKKFLKLADEVDVDKIIRDGR